MLLLVILCKISVCIKRKYIYISKHNSVKDFLVHCIIVGCCFVQNGHTALSVAAIRNHIEIVELLLKFGADVNAKKLVNFDVHVLDMLFFMHASIVQHGPTALLCAAFNGCVEVVQFLLNNGANINDKDYVSALNLLL